MNVHDSNVGKMTDEQIIKAFECCLTADTMADCERAQCPACTAVGCCYGGEDFADTIIAIALDLINRRNAEIERLNKEVDRLSQCVLYHDGEIADAKADGMREVFAKLEERLSQIIGTMHTKDYRHAHFIAIPSVHATIAELKKEMAGED